MLWGETTKLTVTVCDKVIAWISSLITTYPYYENKVILERIGGDIHLGDGYVYEEP